jgi:hypothetical protein
MDAKYVQTNIAAQPVAINIICIMKNAFPAV